MEPQPRRIRRPAVVCRECRRRKIKCDRGNPCRQCSDSLLHCSYARHFSPTPAAAVRPTTASRPHDSGLGSSARPPNGTAAGAWEDYITSSVQAPPPASQFDGIQAPRRRQKSFEPDNGSPVPSSPGSLPPWPLRAGCNEQPCSWKTVIKELAESSQVAMACNTHHDIAEAKRSCARLAHTKRQSRKDLLRESSQFAWAGHPPQPLCDELVNLYLSSLEKVFCVLHRPTFHVQYRQYWDNPQSAASQAFQLTLHLVMAIGACLHPDFNNPQSPLRSFATKWVLESQNWISSILDDVDVSLATLQTYCLVLIARQVSALGPNTIWMSTDVLIRIAMRLGVHRPEKGNTGHNSKSNVQLKRKIWCTVVELAIQSSLDSGIPPAVLPPDMQLTQPINVNDDQLEEALPDNSAHDSPLIYLTDSTAQILLARTAVVRLKIVHFLYGSGDFREGASHSEALMLSTLLNEQCRSNRKTFESLVEHLEADPVRVQVKLLETLTIGSLLALHSPFALCARSDPRLYYSRKIAFEGAWMLEGSPAASRPGPSCLYSQLRLNASGMFERVHLHATALILLELLSSFIEQSFLSNKLFDSQAVFDVVQRNVDICAQRLERGSTDFTYHLIFSIALAHIRVLKNGESQDRLLAEAARKSLRLSLGLMRNATPQAGQDVIFHNQTISADETRPEMEAASIADEPWPTFDLDFEPDQFLQWPNAATESEMPDMFGTSSALACEERL